MAKILLAEDDDSMLNFLMLALESAGHAVVCAKDGTEALQLCKAEEHFDLLLTDIVMPGCDGIELAQSVSELIPNIKVMFITGFAAMAMTSSTDSVKGQKPQVLSKPFHLNDLVTQVEKILAS